jgi:hypothetical protein
MQRGPSPSGEGVYGDPFVRLARLRPEFARGYPGLDVGVWYPAGSLAAYFRSWLVRHPERGPAGEAPRGLETAHFEFRGGVPRDPPWLPGRSPDERHAVEGK